MKIIVEEAVDQSSTKDLISALTPETFADACCVGAISEQEIYLRCPNAKHGVIFDTTASSSSAIAWVIACLSNSIEI